MVISEAAAKPCFSLCWTEHPFQTQNLSDFRATQRTGTTDASFSSRPQKISSPLAGRALSARSLLIPRTKTIGDAYIDDLGILIVLQFSDVYVVSSPIEVQRADALYDFFQMPTNGEKSGSTLSGEFRGVLLDGVSGTLGFPLERQVSLMLVTMLVSAVGVNRTLLRRLLGGWALALAFSTRSFRQPRRVLHRSHHIAAKQTMSTERGSA